METASQYIFHLFLYFQMLQKAETVVLSVFTELGKEFFSPGETAGGHHLSRSMFMY